MEQVESAYNWVLEGNQGNKKFSVWVERAVFVVWHDEVSHALSCIGDESNEWGHRYNKMRSSMCMFDDVHFCLINVDPSIMFINDALAKTGVQF